MKTSQNPNHPVLGSSIKVDPIRSKAAIENIKKILMHQPRNYCLFTLGINTAFRANELLSIQIEQVNHLKAGGEIDLKQKKTKAYRRVKINKTALAALKFWLKDSDRVDGPLFYSQKGTVLTVPSVTRLVKGWCADVGLKGNYGSHTLRKTWGYWQYKNQTPIPVLMEAFGHANQQQTLAYLGIQTKEISQIYNLEL